MVGIGFKQNGKGTYDAFDTRIALQYREQPSRQTQVQVLANRVFQKKQEIDGTEGVWFDLDGNLKLIEPNNWNIAFGSLDNHDIRTLWTHLTGTTGGSREQHWYPESLNRLVPKFQSVDSILISLR